MTDLPARTRRTRTSAMGASRTPCRQEASTGFRGSGGLSAVETADLLDGSVPAADSALQRARATMGRHRDRTADASPAPAEVVPPPGGRWTPPPGDVGTLVMVVAGTTTLFAGSRAATFDAGSMLPFTPATDLGLHNRTRAPVTIVTLTRDGSRMRP